MGRGLGSRLRLPLDAALLVTDAGSAGSEIGRDRPEDLPRATRRGDCCKGRECEAALEGGREELPRLEEGGTPGAEVREGAREREVAREREEETLEAREGGRETAWGTGLPSKIQPRVLSAFQTPQQRVRRGVRSSSSLNACDHSLIK